MEYINEKLKQFNNYIKGKKIAIVGLGVSNRDLIDYLYEYGANVTVFHNKEIEKLDTQITQKLEKYNFDYYFGEDALSNLKGFSIIFRSPSGLPTIPEFVEEVKNGALLTTEIEMLIKLAPCKIIGITGTEGKTTTSSIIHAIIKEAGYNCYLGGNIGTPLFTKISEMTPDDIIILEMSSFQLMDMDVSPEISVVTNIYPDHLNIHSSYEEYREAKKNIFKYQNENDIVILNYDNEFTKEFAKEANGKVILFSSTEKLSDGYIYDKNDGTLKFCDDGIRRHILNRNDIKLRGIHNYENICTALAATSSLVDIDTQVKAIKEFNGVEHRLEFVKETNGVKWYNDSIGTSPTSTIAGLNAFDENIILLAGGSDKGLDYKEVGEAIVEKVGILMLTGPTAPLIEEATKNALAKSNKDVKIYHCKSLEEAVNLANEVSKIGDIVLLSPASASFDAFKNFAERGEKFKEYVTNL